MSDNRVKSLVEKIYRARKMKLVDPEGYFDAMGRWWPHPREDADDCSKVAKPTTKNRYSIRAHCRTKHHVRILVGRALQGKEVPEDVELVVHPRGDAPIPPPMTTRVQLPKGLTERDVPRLMAEFAEFLHTKGYMREANA